MIPLIFPKVPQTSQTESLGFPVTPAMKGFNLCPLWEDMGRHLRQPTTPPVGVFFGLMAVGCVEWLGFLMCSYLPNLPTVLPVQKSMVRCLLII